jgi:hypothetical protein
LFAAAIERLNSVEYPAASASELPTWAGMTQQIDAGSSVYGVADVLVGEKIPNVKLAVKRGNDTSSAQSEYDEYVRRSNQGIKEAKEASPKAPVETATAALA